MEKVIVIVGPTGVGKTALGVALAKQLNGEVISGDSMQIYKRMDIGTAKVTEDEMQGVVHHLIDIKEPSEEYSVTEFQETVRACIDDIVKRGKLPIIVGGTGLYIKAVLYDYTFEKCDSDPKKMEEKYKDYSNEELYERLKEVDPGATRNIHPNNRRRVLRAIEIFETTGKRKSEMEDAQRHEMIYDATCIGLTLDREKLYERIDKRVDIMMENGLEQEVKSLIEEGCKPTYQSMRGIGYKAWFEYFEGRSSKEEVIALIKKHSRNYAKRQFTWFNNQMMVNWYEVNVEHFEETVNKVKEDLINGHE